MGEIQKDVEKGDIQRDVERRDAMVSVVAYDCSVPTTEMRRKAELRK